MECVVEVTPSAREPAPAYLPLLGWYGISTVPVVQQERQSSCNSWGTSHTVFCSSSPSSPAGALIA